MNCPLCDKICAEALLEKGRYFCFCEGTGSPNSFTYFLNEYDELYRYYIYMGDLCIDSNVASPYTSSKTNVYTIGRKKAKIAGIQIVYSNTQFTSLQEAIQLLKRFKNLVAFT